MNRARGSIVVFDPSSTRKLSRPSSPEHTGSDFQVIVDMSDVDEKQQHDQHAGATAAGHNAEQKEDDEKYATWTHGSESCMLNMVDFRKDQEIILRPCPSTLCTRISSTRCLRTRTSLLAKSTEGNSVRKLLTAGVRTIFDEPLLSGTYRDGEKKLAMTSTLLCD